MNNDEKKLKSKSDQPIVKYDRDFCKFKQINLLSKVDQDLFFSVLSIIRERRQTTITITGDELIKRSGYLQKRARSFTKRKLIKLIDDMTDHINSCYIFWHDEDKNVDCKLFLFQSFTINRATADFTASLTPAFAHFFFDIQKSLFTRFALPGFLALKSKYSKVLYRLFLDNYAGLEIEADKLFDLLGIKSSTSQRQFIYKLPIYLNEIQHVTKDFIGPVDYQVIKEHERGRGGKYKSVIFTYKERPGRVIESDNNDNKLPLCPFCGEQLTWRKNKQTGKNFICHQNSSTKCQNPYYDSLEDLQHKIDEVDRERKAKAKAISAAMKDPVYNAIISDKVKQPDLPEDFDPVKLLAEKMKRL